MSLSLIPYGFPVPDGANDAVSNVVNIDATALIEAGLYNMSVVQALQSQSMAMLKTICWVATS